MNETSNAPLIDFSGAFSYPKTTWVNIKCVKCDIVQYRKITSVRSNLKRNSNQYICHKCAITDQEYVQNNLIKHPKTGSKWDSKIDVVCSGCQKKYKITYRGYMQAGGNGKVRCRSCANSEAHASGKFNIYDEDFKNKLKENSEKFWDENRGRWRQKMGHMFDSEEYKRLMSEYGKKPWSDPIYREKMLQLCDNPEHRAMISERFKKMWADTKFRDRMMKLYGTSEWRKTVSDAGKIPWSNPEFRAMKIRTASDDGKRAWLVPGFREKMAIVRSQQPRCSSLQLTLYSILDDLGVKHYREYMDKPADKECIIGPWTFDSVVIRPGQKDLLIDVNDEYWHGSPKVIAKDAAKASYVANNLSHKYELKYLWGNDFIQKDKVVETIKYWLGITKMQAIDFDFKTVAIKPSPSKDYKPLLAKYHYLPNAGRGGIVYGGYIGEVLVSACVFSPLIRQNIHDKLGCAYSEACELSRLCVHPMYQKHNFASWFVSRCIKSLPKKYRVVVSYCDTTFNHNGAVYKACNFEYAGEIKPDYWYVDADGWTMHKRTLYGRAVKLRISEADFAKKYGYIKVYGGKKLRFIYRR